MLQIRGLDVYYGKLHILKKVSLHVNKGEIVALLGANGAGKSTLLNTLIGLIVNQGGEILYQGQYIHTLPPEKRVALGITLVPEGKGIFKPLTVEENLILGSYSWYSFRKAKLLKETLEEVYTLFPMLKIRRKQLAGTLSGGQQQILAIARALMSRPSLLLLDEPSMGLAPNLIKEIFQYIQKLKRELKLSILLVEQNARSALSIADRAYILETGKILFEGDAPTIAGHPEVQRAYLGRDIDADVPL